MLRTGLGTMLRTGLRAVLRTMVGIMLRAVLRTMLGTMVGIMLRAMLRAMVRTMVRAVVRTMVRAVVMMRGRRRHGNGRRRGRRNGAPVNLYIYGSTGCIAKSKHSSSRKHQHCFQVLFHDNYCRGSARLGGLDH